MAFALVQYLSFPASQIWKGMETDLSPEASCYPANTHKMKEKCERKKTELKGILLVLIAGGQRRISLFNILSIVNSSSYKFFYLPLRPLLFQIVFSSQPLRIKVLLNWISNTIRYLIRTSLLGDLKNSSPKVINLKK